MVGLLLVFGLGLSCASKPVLCGDLLYQATDLTGLVGRPGFARVAINDFGEIVGTAGGEGFVWSPWGGMRLLDALSGGMHAEPAAISNYGEVVGKYWRFGAAKPDPTGVRWGADGRAHEMVAPPGSTWVEAWGINDLGQAVGWWTSGTGTLYCYMQW